MACFPLLRLRIYSYALEISSSRLGLSGELRGALCCCSIPYVLSLVIFY